MNNLLVNIFFELVKIDSPSKREKKVAIYLKKWLKKQGFSYNQDKIGNILAYKAGEGEPILFCAHMDTVEPGCGINPILAGEYIKSDGKTILGADNKASITAIICGIEKYLALNNKKHKSIEILFSVKEEIGGGVELMDFSTIKSSSGIIFDLAMPLGTIVLSSPYIYNIHFSFLGKSAHASLPEKGKNSLKTIAKFINLIKLGRLDNGLTTINLGKISGCNVINTIPGEVILSGEVRSFDKILFEQHLKNLIQIAKKCAIEDSIKLKVIKDGYCQGYNLNKNDKFIKKVTSILIENGHKINYYRSNSISDSNPLISTGIKVITLSDGVIDPHTTNEQISIKTLNKLCDLVVDFLNKI